jgi:tetratricopeptide (TPR) repeat protein
MMRSSSSPIAAISLLLTSFAFASASAVQGCNDNANNSNNNSTSSGGSGVDASVSAPTPDPTDESRTPPPLNTPVDSGVMPIVEQDVPSAPVRAQSGPRVPPPPPRPEMSAGARETYRSGLAAAQQGNLQVARETFERALAEDTRAFAAAYNAGIIAERQGQDAAADSFYQRALSIQPDYELALVARSRLLVRQRRVPDAVTFAADIARRFPGNFVCRAEYARLLVIAERYDQAVEEARAILRLDERNVVAKLAVAEAFRARGRLDNSLYIVDDLINGSDPAHPNSGPGVNDARAHYLRALLRVEVNRDVPGAIVSFTRATELDPQFAEAHNNLGVYLLQAGNVEQAVSHLRAAAALSPSWAKAHLNLGDALRAEHRYDEAIAELQRAQQLDASMVETHYDFGRLYGEQAREIANQGIDNLTRKIALLNQSQQSFSRFRDALGPAFVNHPRAADVNSQLERLTAQITRATTVLQREQRRASRGTASSGADAGAASVPTSTTQMADGGTR